MNLAVPSHPSLRPRRIGIAAGSSITDRKMRQSRSPRIILGLLCISRHPSIEPVNAARLHFRETPGIPHP
jgi:hypothetical protein